MNIAPISPAGNSQLDQNEIDSARIHAERLVQQSPNNAHLRFQLSEVYCKIGDYAQALEHAEIAVALAPQDFEFLYQAGVIYKHFKLYELALPVLNKSVLLEPRACLSQFELALCYYELHLVEKALPHFQRALKLEPASALKDDIRYFIANCYFATNQASEALPLFKRLAKDSRIHRVNAYAAICDIEVSTPNSSAANLISKMLVDPETTPLERRTLWLAIGKILSRSGEVEKAFAAWDEAAKLGLQVQSFAFRDHDREFDEITRFYSKQLFEQCQQYGHDSESPVFLACMPRSGSTLVEQIIASHSFALGVGELPRWGQLDEAFRKEYSDVNSEARVAQNASEGELIQRAEETLGFFRAIVGDIPKRIVEKLPYNFLYAGYHALMFKNAKFIHLQRHPADSFLSTYENDFSAFHSYGLTQVEYIKEYNFQMRLMAHWKSIFPERILTVRYENLVTNPETEVRRIIDFLGLPWEDQCLEFHRRNSAVRTFSIQQVRKPVYTSSVSRWPKFAKQLGPLFQAMDQLGLKYPVDD